jgi:serine-type D-Ala-D-Ala carboxypeptidase (penicillin-binding protein 5/6)
MALVLLCASLVQTASPAVAAPAPPRVACRGCFLVDDAGRVLWRRHPDLELANASTTKMVTALVVRRASRLGDIATVSRHAAAIGQGGFDLEAGESYTVRDLLYALLLTSSNDAAVALAEEAAGSEDAFVARMNLLVGDMGLQHTHFVTPHGLDRPDHYSSPRDLAAIGLRVLQDPELAAIVSSPRARIATPTGPARLASTNALLKEYRGAVGVKTGRTDDAGEVLVAAAVRNDRRVIAVAMHSRDAAADATRLLDYGFARLSRTVLVQPGAIVGHLFFDSAGSVGAVTEGAVRGLAEPAAVDLLLVPEPGLELPLEGNEVVGTLEVVAAGRVIRRAAVFAAQPLEPAATSWPGRLLAGFLGAGHQLASWVP